jgi:hypothetical protein
MLNNQRVDSNDWTIWTEPNNQSEP